jgi:serine/threonine protein phosphatase 1
VWKLPSLRSGRHLPKVPDGTRIYAIGDVHGRADLLALVMQQIEIDILLHPVAKPIVVFLGDYVDRGPASKEVLDLLLGSRQMPEMVFLKGNHEAFVLDMLRNSARLDDWRRYGGLETLISYGLKPPINPTASEQVTLVDAFAKALPETHRRFLETLQTSFDCGDFLFVHAGVRPLVPLSAQTEHDLLWIRDDFLNWDKKFEKVIVHGHTPVEEPDVRFNRINIDTGAFATGRLTCMTFEASDIMPLMDVRDWSRDIPCIETSSSGPTQPGQDAGPDIAGLIKRLKDDTSACSPEMLVRLNPRQR